MSEPAVLFVCLGNICRSPLAEAAFRARAADAGLDARVDSAGTSGWHIGDPPDRRAQTTALRHGADISRYRGRQIEPADFRCFTHIFALDQDNLASLRQSAPPDGTAEVGLLLDLVDGLRGEAVADPYYGDESGFERTWGQVDAAAQALVARLTRDRAG
jgi:protein-tyrosine phosphatase